MPCAEKVDVEDEGSSDSSAGSEEEAAVQALREARQDVVLLREEAWRFHRAALESAARRRSAADLLSGDAKPKQLFEADSMEREASILPNAALSQLMEDDEDAADASD